jgi:hypothetical protein
VLFAIFLYCFSRLSIVLASMPMVRVDVKPNCMSVTHKINSHSVVLCAIFLYWFFSMTVVHKSSTATLSTETGRAGPLTIVSVPRQPWFCPITPRLSPSLKSSRCVIYCRICGGGTWPWLERCVSIPMITSSNTSGGSEFTFRSDLLLTARGGCTYRSSLSLPVCRVTRVTHSALSA